MTQAGWIAVDWGTTHLRAYAMGPAGVCGEASSTDGMGTLTRDGYEPALLQLVERIDENRQDREQGRRVGHHGKVGTEGKGGKNICAMHDSSVDMDFKIVLQFLLYFSQHMERNWGAVELATTVVT